MGLLDAFAGALSGGAQFMADDIQKQIALERQQALEESRMAAQEAMNIRAEDRAVKLKDTERTKRAEAIATEAQRAADARGTSLSDQAKSAYADNPEGLAAVDDAIKRGAYKQDVTTRDRVQGLINSGYADPTVMANLEHQDRQDAHQERRDEIADKHWTQSYEIQKKQLDLAAANGEITRQEHQLKLDELKQQNDPAARSLLAQGLQSLSKGDKDGAMEAFRVAGSHYGNKDAIELMTKISAAKNANDLSAIAHLYETANREGDRDLADEAKSAAVTRMKNQQPPGEDGKPGIGAVKVDPNKYPDGTVLRRGNTLYTVKNGVATPQK